MNDNRRRSRVIFGLVILLVGFLGATSCSLFGRGGPKDVLLILSGTEELNACGGQLGNALSLRIYQLTNDTAIRNLPLQDLWTQDESALGTDKLGSRWDLFLDPGVRDTLKVKLQAGAGYLAVVGNFCDTEGDCWRWIQPTISLGSVVLLEFGKACVEELQPEEPPAKWRPFYDEDKSGME